MTHVLLYNYDMAVNIYYSNTFRGAFDSLSKVLKKNLNESNIIIVPDRFSLTIEKAILDKLNIAGSMNIEVMSFSRLAATLLKDTINKCLTPESAIMLLAKVIRKSREDLLCYKNIREITAFSKNMYAAISEIRNSGITVEMLKNALSKTKNAGIARKTADIITLYEKYLNELSLNYNDATTRLERLIDEIPNNQRIKESNIYITDFYFFKHTEYGIIEELMQHAKSLNIALIKKPDNASLNGRIYPNYKIKSRAARLNIEVVEHYNHYQLEGINGIIERRLFAYDNEEISDSLDKIKLLHAPEIESELTAVARQIRAVIKEGRRYNEIAVVTGDIIKYTPYIENVFERFDIPFFIDRKEPLANHPLIRFIFALYDCINEDYAINYVFELIKNPFFSTETKDTNTQRKEAEIFENICIKYGIKGRQLRKKVKYIEEDRNIFERIRRRLVKLFDTIGGGGEISVDENIIKLFDLLKSVKMDDKMKALVKHQAEFEDRSYAEVTKQLPVKLEQILSEIKEMLGGQLMNTDEFAVLFKASIGNTSVSMIPQYIDSVFVGEPIESRYAVIKALFIVGADENSLPVSRKDNGIITSYDAGEWGLEINPDIYETMNLDKLHIHQLLIKPEQQLTVSYCSRDISGDFLNPSIVMKQLEKIFGLKTESVIQLDNEPYHLEGAPRAEFYARRFSTYKNAINELSIKLRKIKEGKSTAYDLMPYDAMYSILNAEEKEQILEINNLHKDSKPYIRDAIKLFFGRDMTSVSQLESYFRCPFRHFVGYGIKAQKREVARMEANIIGLIIHKALELFLQKLIDDANGFQLSEEQKGRIIDSVIVDVLDKYEQECLIDDSNRDLIIESIIRALNNVYELLGKSSFKPCLVESEFGRGKDFPPIEINYGNNKKVFFKGKIDRIDRHNEDIIVIDYKTGNVKDDIKNELYYGAKIQLFVYLSAIAKDNFKPVGMMYMLINDKFIKDGAKTYPFTGLILDSAAKDFDLTPNDGELIDRKKSSVDEDLLRRLIAYAMDISSKACEEISDGYIESKPDKDACSYCDYKDICRARLKEPLVRKLPSIRKFDFDLEDKDGKVD